MSHVTPCLSCGQPTRAQVASQAELARGALEVLLDRLGWPHDPVLSAAVDRLVELTQPSYDAETPA